MTFLFVFWLWYFKCFNYLISTAGLNWLFAFSCAFRDRGHYRDICGRLPPFAPPHFVDRLVHLAPQRSTSESTRGQTWDRVLQITDLGKTLSRPTGSSRQKVFVASWPEVFSGNFKRDRIGEQELIYSLTEEICDFEPCDSATLEP